MDGQVGVGGGRWGSFGLGPGGGFPGGGVASEHLGEFVGAGDDRRRDAAGRAVGRAAPVGPEMETACNDQAGGRADRGGRRDATPGSRSPTLCDQPRRRTPESVVALKAAAPGGPGWSRSGSSQARRTWAAGAREHRHRRPDGMESRRPTGRSAAETQTRVVALTPEELGALSFVCGRAGRRRTGPAAASSRSSLADAAKPATTAQPEDEPPLEIAGDKPVVFEATARRCAVGGPGRSRVTN